MNPCGDVYLDQQKYSNLCALLAFMNLFSNTDTFCFELKTVHDSMCRHENPTDTLYNMPGFEQVQAGTNFSMDTITKVVGEFGLPYEVYEQGFRSEHNIDGSQTDLPLLGYIVYNGAHFRTWRPHGSKFVNVDTAHNEKGVPTVNLLDTQAESIETRLRGQAAYIKVYNPIPENIE